MKPNPLTIDDIARLSKVNKSTVSRVINHTAGVTISEKTRERVLAVIARTGFRKHAVASRLKSGFRDIAVAIAEPEQEQIFSPIYQEILTRLTLAFGERGKHVALHHYTRDVETNLRNNLEPSLYAGVVVLGSYPYEVLGEVAQHIPCMRVFHHHPAEGMNFFLHDHDQAARLALDFLSRRGVRKVTALFYAKSRLLLERAEALEKAATHFETVRFEPLFLTDSPTHTPLPHDELHHLLDRARVIEKVHSNRDALLFAGDSLGLWGYFARRGFKAPDQASLLAWDRPTAQKHLMPGLSSVAIDYKALAEKICSFFDTPQRDVVLRLQSELYEGETVRGA